LGREEAGDAVFDRVALGLWSADRLQRGSHGIVVANQRRFGFRRWVSVGFSSMALGSDTILSGPRVLVGKALLFSGVMGSHRYTGESILSVPRILWPIFSSVKWSRLSGILPWF
jgi:hypothetical protein